MIFQLHSVLIANDSCLSLSETNYVRLIRKFNDELIKFDNKLIANRLTLNVEKPVTINFSTRFFDVHSVLRINNENLSFLEFTKHLGIFIDRKFVFIKHAETICKKL